MFINICNSQSKKFKLNVYFSNHESVGIEWIPFSGSRRQVIFGGGRRTFLPNTTADPEYGTVDSNHRQDGRNLIQVRGRSAGLLDTFVDV